MQDEYDTFIILADIQALTTHFKQPELISKSIYVALGETNEEILAREFKEEMNADIKVDKLK